MKVLIWAVQGLRETYPTYHGPFMTVAQAEKQLFNLNGKCSVFIEPLKDAEIRTKNDTALHMNMKERIVNSLRLLAVDSVAVKREVVSTSGQKAA